MENIQKGKENTGVTRAVITIADWVKELYPNFRLQIKVTNANPSVVGICSLDSKECLAKGESHHDFSFMGSTPEEIHLQRIFTAYCANGCKECERNLKDKQ